MIEATRKGDVILIKTDRISDSFDLMWFNNEISKLLKEGEKIISINIIEYRHAGIEYGIAIGYEATKFMLLIG